MPCKAHYLLLFALLCAAPRALASVVQRCEAANGDITYTSLGCKAGESLTHQDVRPSPPHSTTALLPEAEGHATSNMRNNNRGREVSDHTGGDRAQRVSEGTRDRKGKSRTAKSPQ
jgi:hypothetical protein